MKVEAFLVQGQGMLAMGDVGAACRHLLLLLRDCFAPRVWPRLSAALSLRGQHLTQPCCHGLWRRGALYGACRRSRNPDLSWQGQMWRGCSKAKTG